MRKSEEEEFYDVLHIKMCQVDNGNNSKQQQTLNSSNSRSLRKQEQLLQRDSARFPWG